MSAPALYASSVDLAQRMLTSPNLPFALSILTRIYGIALGLAVAG